MVKALDIESINKKSPYCVSQDNENIAYKFTTQYRVRYQIDFLPDDMVESSESYQFIIQNLNNSPSPRDAGVRDTIICIIEEFFNKNTATLLYICETSDGKQSMRNRLFEYWLKRYNRKDDYTILSTSVKDTEGVTNYVSIIIRNDNPCLEAVTKEFEETSFLLSQKPE